MEQAWIAAYSRKSRHLDRDIPEEELFAHHKALLKRKAAEDRLPLPEERIFMEVGSSETIEERPVFKAILEEIDALPLRKGGHLIIIDPDRLTRADMVEQAQIYARIQRAGVRLHQVMGGELDLNNLVHEMTLHLKGVVSRWLIQEYKQKVRDTKVIMREDGEVRNGRVPFGFYNDKGEKYVRDRVKADDRTRDHTGLTPHEKLVRICREVLDTSVGELAQRYDVPVTTLFSTLKTPSIAGYPVTRTWLDPERKRKSHRHRLLPRDQWLWPKKPGNYPPACTLDEWWAIQDAIECRKDGQVKKGDGQGICRDVVRFLGTEGRVILSRMHRKGGPASYRMLCRPTREVERTLVDEAACAWLRDLVGEEEGRFFAWMLTDYYQQRSTDPLPKNEELARLDGQLRRWQQEREEAQALVLQSDTQTEKAGWLQQAKRLAELIEATERQRDEVRRRRSPIATIDRLVPQLLPLAQRVGPGLWWRYWPELWETMPLPLKRQLVSGLIGAIWVQYQQHCYRGPAVRVIDRIEPSGFVQEARDRYQRMLTCSTTSRRSLVELWSDLERLAA